ncbi:hypothetical protein [Clavibacter zhangzhiyongii]|uniref:hypothetical protein n=1 Tax=Clavibacter zhangzhiyongii TaxID=2768071 RepID=UPI0039E0BAB3
MTSTAPDRTQPLFRRIRRAWADAPVVVQAVAAAALLFAWLTALDIGDPSEGSGTIVLRAVVAALMAGVLFISVRRSRGRRQVGAPSWVEVSEATEDGELPPGADVRRVAGCAGATSARRSAPRPGASCRSRWSSWSVVSVVFLPPVRPDRDPAYIVFLAVFVSWAAWLVVSRTRRRDAVDALLIPLQESARDDAARRAGWPPPAPEDRIPPAAG